MPPSITVDTKQLRRLEKDLRVFSDKAFLIAEKQTVNDAAFFAMRETKKFIRRDFVNRNKFTEKSIRVHKAASLSRPVAEMGSLNEYMVDQELGGVRRKSGKHGVAIPTSYAAGQGKSKRRTKPVKRKYRLSNIKVASSKKSLSIPGSIQSAVNRGQRIVFLNLKNGKAGIFEIVGARGKRVKLFMLYDLTQDSIPVKKEPTISPATNKAIKRIPEFYVENIKFQVRRLGLFVD